MCRTRQRRAPVSTTSSSWAATTAGAVTGAGGGSAAEEGASPACAPRPVKTFCWASGTVLGCPAQPAGFGQVTAQFPAGIFGRHGDVVGVRTPGEHDAEALDAGSHQFAGEFFGRCVAGVVMVISDETPLHPVVREGGPVLVGETSGAVGGGHVAQAGAPKAEGVYERLAEDDFAAGEAALVPDASVRAGQVEVGGLAGAGVPVELAAVDFDHSARGLSNGDNHTTVEVLVARLAEEAKPL